MLHWTMISDVHLYSWNIWTVSLCTKVSITSHFSLSPFIPKSQLLIVATEWYNGFASIGAQEKFREQALRSLATATVQLSAFKYSQAGSPSFDENGNLQAIEPARVVDHPTNHRRLCAKIFDNYENFCDLGPYHDSADYFQCMLDKHLQNKTDISRGVSQALRLFLDWIPKEAPIETETFVMAHPDFNLQNVLVAEDGTLQGLIDWDGVSAVPRSVGCLFPKWLTFDWDPAKYTYGMDFGSKFQYHHSPAEMKHYRALYAGFIAESATKCQAQAGDIPLDLADLTRRSLVIDSVNQAAKNPFSTTENVFNILDKITHITSQAYFKAYCDAYEGTIKEGELTNPAEHNLRIESVAQAEEHSSTNGSSDLGDSVFSDTSMVTRDSTEISEPPSEQEGQQTAPLQHSDLEAFNGNNKEEQGIVNQQSSKIADKCFLNSMKERKPWRRVPSLVQSTSHQLRASIKRLKVTKSQRMQSSWVTLSPKTVQTNTFETNSTTLASTSSRADKINQPEPLSNNLASILHDEASGEKDGTISATASGRLHTETTVKQKIKQNQTDASDADGQCGLSSHAHCVQCQVPVLSTEHLNALSGSVRLQKEQEDGSLPSNSLSGTSVLRKDTFGRRLKAKLSMSSSKKRSEVRASSPTSSADSRESRCKRILSWIRKTSQKPRSNEQKSVSSWDSDSTLPEIPHVSVFELPSMDEADFKMKNDMKDMNETMGESSNTMTELITTRATKLPSYDAGEPVDKYKLHKEGFSRTDIVFDLADGKFDETRMRRLRLGFAALLDSL